MSRCHKTAASCDTTKEMQPASLTGKKKAALCLQCTHVAAGIPIAASPRSGLLDASEWRERFLSLLEFLSSTCTLCHIFSSFRDKAGATHPTDLPSYPALHA